MMHTNSESISKMLPDTRNFQPANPRATNSAINATAQATASNPARTLINGEILCFCSISKLRLTKKAEPPPTRDVNRDSGTASANGGWLRRLVRPLIHASESPSDAAPANVKSLRQAQRRENWSQSLSLETHHNKYLRCLMSRYKDKADGRRRKPRLWTCSQ